MRESVGRARLIVLVELSNFAVETGAYDRAPRYVVEAQTLDPGPSEQHDLRTISGMLALNAGDLGQASRLLAESIRVCQADDFARVTCAVRPPNLMLAEKLIERGEREAVARYLTGCQHVWKQFANQIALWRQIVKNGQMPDFSSSPVLNTMGHLRVKLLTLLMKASLLGDTLQESEASMRGTGKDWKKMREEFQRITAAAIKGKLGAGRN